MTEPCRAVANVKFPFALKLKLSPPLFWSTTVPLKPLIDPPIVKVAFEQVTETDVTFAEATVPLPLVTVHVWPAG